MSKHRRGVAGANANNSSNATAAEVGKTTVIKDFREGASSIYVASALELFGPLVHMVREDGKFSFQFTKGAAPRTIQLGASLAVNVTEVHNNELKVTPITVKEHGKVGDVVLFCCTGPSGLEHARSADESRNLKVNFEAVKREVEELERMGAFNAMSRAGSPEEGNRKTRQQEAEEAEVLGDQRFWEGMFAEKADRPERLLHCPVFDGDSRPCLEARLKYTEALRHFGRCVELDQTRLEYFMKRCAALCKLMDFEKALPDAETYVSLRPDCPTGYCLKGVAHHGLRQYGAAIDAFRTGLELGEIVVYDRSRVWSTGTLLRTAMDLTIELRGAVAEKAKVANQHGVHWRELNQFGRALPCLLEAVELNAQSVGKAHPFYGTCVNNVGACMEALGNYDEALKRYTAALRVAEQASKGVLRVFLQSGRHMPHGMENGRWEGEEWVADGFSCDAYVVVELQQSAREGDERLTQNKAKPISASLQGAAQHVAHVERRTSRVARQSYQPVWNQVMTLRADRGDAAVTVMLMSQSRQRVLLEDRAEDLERAVRECEEMLRDVRDRLAPLQQRVHRLTELGRVKQAELVKARRNLEEVQGELGPLEAHKEELEQQIQQLRQRQQAFPDREIGRFSYPLAKLSSSLNGLASSAEKSWFSIPDASGGKLRGEDFGLTAVQIELTWTPEDAEYATRLSNIGNLHRILGDMHSSRTGAECDLKKLEKHYQLAEQHLEEALTAMRTAMSLAPPQREHELAAGLKRSQQPQSATVDGRNTLQYCVVLENMALLNQAMGHPQSFPKGTPETVRAKFENAWKENRARAVERLREAMAIRSSLSGTATKEYWTLLTSLIDVLMDMDSVAEALALQEEAAGLSKLLFGEVAEQTTRETGVLNQLHLVSGDAHVRALPERGRWVVDTAEAWHWVAVSPLSRRVGKAVAKTQQRCAEERAVLQEEEERMQARRQVLLDPPPITDFALNPGDEPQLRKAFEAQIGEGGLLKKSPLKSAKVTASKLQTPDTELVRRDIQPWPYATLHTKAS